MRDLLRTLKDGRTWREVASLLAHIGGVNKSASWWLQLARSEKSPHREDENAVRRCFPGWPDVPPSAGELVDALDIINGIVAGDKPDTALLVHTGGAHVAQIVIRASDLPVTIPTTRLVTGANITVVKRRDRQPIHVFRLSTMDAQGLETIRGKSGDLTRISDAASLARATLDYVPTASECAAWLAALNQMEVM